MRLPTLIGFLLFTLHSVPCSSNDGISYYHEESLDKIKVWVKNVQGALNKLTCSFPMDHESLAQEDMFIQSVICGHPSSYSDFSWEGSVDKHGQFDGRGKMKFGVKGVPKTGRQCIRLGKKYDGFFGGKMVELNGTFARGTLSEKDTITVLIDRGENGTLTVEATVKSGALHGVYKVTKKESNKWSIGLITKGELDLSNCWVFDSDKIYHGDCQDVMIPGASREGFIVLDNFKTSMTGILSSDGSTIYDALYFRLDLSAQNSSHCYMSISGDKIYPHFIYSIVTKTRIEKPSRDVSSDDKAICSRIDDRKVASSLNAYFQIYLDNFASFFHFKAHPSPLDNKPIYLISRLDHVEGQIYEAVFTFKRKTFSEFKYTGDLDEEGNFHGFGILELSNKNQCMRGKCSIPEINLISGTFSNGVLEGGVFIISEQNIQMSAAVARKGVLHGRVLTKGMIPHYPYPESHENPHQNYNLVKMNGLGFYGYFLNGKPSGYVWYGMVGFEFSNQGLLHGKLDSHGKLTGHNISYVYPNHYNVLYGEFEDKFMKAATYRHIDELHCNEDGILFIKVSEKPSDIQNEQVYFYDPPSNVSLGSLSMLLVEDPYEADTISIAESFVPHSGKGLFARRNVQKHEVLTWYSGMLFNGEETKLRDEACRLNSTLSGKAVAQCYKYRISTYHGALIDIPVEYDDDSKYRATLGHKINNGFGHEVNAAFHQSEHPRFGVIVNTLATKPIQAGSELIVNYGYFKVQGKIGKVFDWYYKAEDEYNQKLERKS